jgi:hypothetical protein
MGTYNLPRNVKGEGRILFIFSTKSLITTFIGAIVGFPFYFILHSLKHSIIGFVFILVFAVIGYGVGMLKVPDNNGNSLSRKVGGENLDDVIKRYIKFKSKKKRLYVYTKEDIEK